MSQSNLEYITRLADHLSHDEKTALVEHLTQSLHEESSESAQQAHSPQSLRGVWQNRFSEDFDLDAALKDIRGAWEKEWPEVFNK